MRYVSGIRTTLVFLSLIGFLATSGCGAGTWLINSSSSTNQTASLSLKVFLEGPFDGTSAMRLDLNTGGHIPTNHPYSAAPWNYAGTETVTLTLLTNENVVDWVLVELRSGTAENTFVTQKAALLKSDGRIIDADGENLDGVTFSGTSAGSYYVVIYHRNHLAVMSATPINASESPTLYDFTTATTQGYGGASSMNLVSGMATMWAGDIIQDGVVDGLDATELGIQLSNFDFGYVTGDLDFETNADVNDQTYQSNNQTATASITFPKTF